MKAYRGAEKEDFNGPSTAYIDTIDSATLEKTVQTSARIRFRISKPDASDRVSVCYLAIEECDIIPMINGLLARLTRQNDKVSEIRQISGLTLSDQEKLIQIKKLLSSE